MPGENNKIDFGAAILNGADSQQIKLASPGDANFVIGTADDYKKAGYSADYVDYAYPDIQKKYDAFQRGEYVANWNTKYAAHPLLMQMYHPDWVAKTRDIGDVQITSRASEPGFDLTGKQYMTEQEVADAWGKYYDKNGQVQDLGGEFWNWAKKAGMGILDAANLSLTVGGLGLINLGLDALGIKTTYDLMNDLHSYGESKMMNYDNMGNPYWQVFNTYENPTNNFTKDWYDGLMTNEQLNQINQSIALNPKGYTRSVYGAQPFEGRSFGGNLLRGFVDTLGTFIPATLSGITGWIDNVNTAVTGNEDWTYLRSIEYGNEIAGKETKHPSSYMSQFKPWYSGERLGTGIGEVVGQLAIMAAGGSAGKAAGMSSKAAGNMSRGMFSVYSAGVWNETMNDLGIDSKWAAVLYPIFGATTFAVESLIPTNIIEEGLGSVTLRESFKKMAKENATDIMKKLGIESIEKATRSQRIAFAKKLATANMSSILSLSHMPGRMLSTGLEEGSEEVIEQFVNDATTTFSDYLMTIQNNTREKDNQLNTFKAYDIDRSVVGNFANNFELDDYTSSFVLGFMGGVTGGIRGGKNVSKAGEQTILQYVADGKEKELYRELNKTNLHLNYIHTDGINILTEEDNAAGKMSMNDLTKQKIKEDIDKLVEIRDKTGINTAKGLGYFGGDQSLAYEALKRALIVTKVKDKMTALSLKENATEEDKVQVEQWGKDVQQAEQELQENYLKPENAGAKTSRAYNNKMKSVLSIKAYAEHLYEAEERKAGIEPENRTSEQEEKRKLAIGSTILALTQDSKDDNLYDRYKVFVNDYMPNKVNEIIQKQAEVKKAELDSRDAKNSEYAGIIAGINANIEVLDPKSGDFTDMNELLQKRSNSITAEEEAELDSLKNEENPTPEQLAKISQLENKKVTSITDSELKKLSEIQRKFLTTKTNISDSFDQLVEEIIRTDSPITPDNKSALMAISQNLTALLDEGFDPRTEDIDVLRMFDPMSAIQIEEESVVPTDEEADAMIMDDIEAEMNLLRQNIEDKSPFSVVNDQYKKLVNKINSFRNAMVIGNKVIDKIDDGYKSSDNSDKAISDERYNAIINRINENSSAIDDMKAEIDQYSGNKETLTREYKIQEIKTRYLTWAKLIQIIPNAKEVFGDRDFAEISSSIKILDKELCDENNNFLAPEAFTDDHMIKMDSILTKLQDIFFDHRQAAFEHKTFLHEFISNFYFGPNGFEDINGRNIVNSGISEEPIRLFDVGEQVDSNEFWRKIEKTDSRYNKFLSMYAMNYFLAMAGAKSSNVLNTYKEMERAADYNEAGNPSSYEQFTMEMQAVSLMLAGKTEFKDGKSYLDVYEEAYSKHYNTQRNLNRRSAGFKETDPDKLDYDIKSVIKNVINFTGFGGSGKTNNSIGKIVKLYSRMIGKADVSITVSAYSNKTTNQLRNAVTRSGKIISANKFENIQQLDFESDIVIFDEATLLDGSKLEANTDLYEINQKIEKSKNKPMIIFLSDNTQAMSPEAQVNPRCYRSGLTMNPLMNIYRTSIPAIIQLSEYYRRKISINDSDRKMPAVSYREVNGNLIGGRYFGSREELISFAKARIIQGKDVAVIVDSVEARDALTDIPREKIFIVSSEKKDAEISIQGLQAKEVFMAFIPKADDTFREGQIGYTAISRANNFIGVIGNTSDNIYSDFVGSQFDEATPDEKKELSSKIQKYLDGVRDKNSSDVQYDTFTSGPSIVVQQTSTNIDEKEAFDSNGNSIKIGDNVITPSGETGEVIQIPTIDSIVINEKENISTQVISKIEDESSDNNLMEQKTLSSGDKEIGTKKSNRKGPEYTDYERKTHSFMNVFDIAINPNVELGKDQKDKLDPEIRKLKVLRFMELQEMFEKDPQFQYDVQNYTYFDQTKWTPENKGTVSVQGKILTAKLDSDEVLTIIRQYPPLSQLNDEEEIYVLNAMENFFIIQREEKDNATKAIYEALDNGANVLDLTLSSGKIDKVYYGKIHFERDENGKPKIGTKDTTHNLPTAAEVEQKLKDRGYEVSYIWKAKGVEKNNPLKGGKCYLRYRIPGTSIDNDIPLTSFTVAEQEKRNKVANSEETSYFDTLQLAFKKIDAIIEDDKLDRRSKKDQIESIFHNERIYHFFAKNGSPELANIYGKKYDDIVKIYSEMRGFIEANSQVIKENWFVPYRGTVGTVSRVAYFTPITIGSPRAFAKLEFKQEDQPQTPKTVGVDTINEDDAVFNFEREGVGQTTFIDAVDEIGQFIGEELAERVTTEIPKTEKLYQDMARLYGAFSGFMDGKINLVSENGVVKASTPRHEVVHFVDEYYLSPKYRKDLYTEAKKVLAEKLGTLNITDLQAKEFIADTFARDYDVNTEKPWYSKMPLIGKFIQALKKIMQKIGLVSYKLDDFFYDLETGYYKNGNPDISIGDVLFEMDTVNDPNTSSDRTFEPKVSDLFNKSEIITNLGRKNYAVLRQYVASTIVSNSIFSGKEISPANMHSVDSMIDAVNNHFSAGYKELTFNGKSAFDIFNGGEAVVNTISGNDLKSFFNELMSMKEFRNTIIQSLVPEYTADKARSSSNIGFDIQQRNVRDLSSGINSLIQMSIPRYIETRKGNKKEKVQVGFVDFKKIMAQYVTIVSTNIRPKTMKEALNTMKNGMKTALLDSYSKSNISSFIDYINLLDERAKLNSETMYSIEMIKSAMFTMMNIQYTKQRESAAVKINDGKIESTKLQRKSIGDIESLKSNIKSNIRRSMYANGQINQNTNNAIALAEDTITGKTIFQIRPEGIFFVNGNINERNHKKIISFDENGFKFNEDVFSNRSEFVSTIKALTNITGLRDSFNANFFYTLLSDEYRNMKLKEVTTKTSGRGEDTISQFFAYGFAHSLFSSKINTFATNLIGAFNSAKNVEGKDVSLNDNTLSELDVTRNNLIRLINKYTIGEIPLSELQSFNISKVKSEFKDIKSLYDESIPKYIDSMYAKWNDIFKIQKASSDQGEQDILSETSIRTGLTVPKPVDNFPFIDMMSELAWPMKASAVDNKMRLPDGSSALATTTIAKMDMMISDLKEQVKSGKDKSILYKNDKLLSVFADTNTNYELFELTGLQNGNFGSNEISTTDKKVIELQAFDNALKEGYVVIPLNTFADSGRPQFIRMKVGDQTRINDLITKLYENHLDRMENVYNETKKKWMNFLSNFVNTVSGLYPDMNTSLPTNFRTPNEFINFLNKYEQSIVDSKDLELYRIFSTMLENDPNMHDTREKMRGDILFKTAIVNGKREFFTDDQMNDQDEYTPIHRFTIGKGGLFGLDSKGEVTNAFDSKGESLMSHINYYHAQNYRKLVSADEKLAYIDKALSKIERFDWNETTDIMEEVPAEYINTADGKFVPSDRFKLFSKMNILLGEEFMSTFIGGSYDFSSAESGAKRIKPWLTGVLIGNANKYTPTNVSVMNISDQIGISENRPGKRELCNLLDGGSIINSFVNRIMMAGMGGEFGPMYANTIKDIVVNYNAAIGEMSYEKESAFAPTNSVVDLSSKMRKIQVTMLSQTIVRNKNYGDIYEQMWKDGKSHDEIIDFLFADYKDFIYQKGNPNRVNFVWKMVPVANSKEGVSGVNVGGFEELYQNRQNSITKPITVSDAGFIYNPETNISAASTAKKVIQKMSIFSQIDKVNGQPRTIDTINDILSQQSRVSLNALQKELDLEGINLAGYHLMNQASKQAILEKMIPVIKRWAVSGLSERGTAGVLADMIDEFSGLNIPNVHEQVIQVFVNKVFNDFGPRKGNSADRLHQMFGQQFYVFEDIQTGIKYNLKELNEINNLREDEEYYINSGKYIPSRLGYMKVDGDKVKKGEVVLSFKYFKEMGIRSGEQPMNMFSIYISDGTRIDLRNQGIQFKSGNNSYDVIYDENNMISAFTENDQNISAKQYYQALAGYTQEHPEVFDFDRTPILRKSPIGLSVADRLGMLSKILNVQMDRVPHSTPGFTRLATIVGFINDDTKDILGNIRSAIPNIVFRNMRESSTDGSDNDGDTLTVQYYSFVRDNDGRYSLDVAPDSRDTNYERLNNLIFERIESIALNPANQSQLFDATTLDDVDDAIKEFSRKNKVPRNDYGSSWNMKNKIYESNYNDSSAIGKSANSANVFAELAALSPAARKSVYSGDMVSTQDQFDLAVQIFSKILNAATDGVKKSRLGPMNIIDEFSNLNAYFMMAGRIPGYLVDSTNEYEPYNALNWEAIIKFFNSDMMLEISKNVISGRRLGNSSFTTNLFFSLMKYKQRHTGFTPNIPEGSELTKEDLESYSPETEELVQSLYDKESNFAAKELYGQILYRLKTLQQINGLEQILPAAEGIFSMALLNSLRQKVLAKTHERHDFMRNIEIALGTSIEEVLDLYFDASDELRTESEFLRMFDMKFGKKYPEIAAEFEKANGREYVYDEFGNAILNRDKVENFQDDYEAYIRNKYAAVNAIKYGYYAKYPAEYLRMVKMVDAISDDTTPIISEIKTAMEQKYFSDQKINTYSSKNEEQQLDDALNLAIVNKAFEERPELQKTFKLKVFPESIQAGNPVEFTVNLGNQFDRNIFLYATPDMVSNILELRKMLIRKEDSSPWVTKTFFKDLGIDIDKEKDFITNLIENKFLDNIERTPGQTPGIQFNTQLRNENDLWYLREQANDFNKLPGVLKDIFASYNLLRYGYQQSRSFLEVVGTSIYSPVNNFINEDLSKYENDRVGLSDFINKTLETAYAHQQLASYGWSLYEKKNVKKAAIVKDINIQPGGERSYGDFAKKPVTHFNTNEGLIAKFNQYPLLGAQYGFRPVSNFADPVSEVFTITLQASLRNVYELLSESGKTQIPNSMNGYKSVYRGEKIHYNVFGIPCIATGNSNGNLHLQRTDILQSKDSLIPIKIEGVSIKRELLASYDEYVKNGGTAIVKFIDPSGPASLPTRPEYNGSLIVHDDTMNNSKGMSKGFQFAGQPNTLGLKVAKTGNGSGYVPISLTDIKAENEKIRAYNEKRRSEIVKNIDDFKSSLKSAKSKGVTLYFPTSGIGSSLFTGHRDLYDSLSDFLLKEFGYKNKYYNVQSSDQSIDGRISATLSTLNGRKGLGVFIKNGTIWPNVSKLIEEMISQVDEDLIEPGISEERLRAAQIKIVQGIISAKYREAQKSAEKTEKAVNLINNRENNCQ